MVAMYALMVAMYALMVAMYALMVAMHVPYGCYACFCMFHTIAMHVPYGCYACSIRLLCMFHTVAMHACSLPRCLCFSFKSDLPQNS